MKKDLYYLKVLTPLHVGTGQGVGHIDLPIYREAHTDFPAIPSSAIKGTVRTEEILRIADETGIEPKKVEEFIEKFPGELDGNLPENVKEKVSKVACYFGSQNREGSIVFTDARILLFPVKSLRGIYALITCPYVLTRFAEETGKESPKLGELDDSSCIVFEHSENKVVYGNKEVVVLEEFTFEIEGEAGQDVLNLLDNPKIDKSRVVIVSDNVFTHMVKSYTEVQTHIKVDIEKGTVEGGALWTEEYVPAEAVFYFFVIRQKDDEFSITNRDGVSILQLGGNTSTGKGFVEVCKDGTQES